MHYTIYTHVPVIVKNHLVVYDQVGKHNMRLSQLIFSPFIDYILYSMI